MSDPVEEVVAPAAIERAFGIYQQLQQRDQSVLLQARKILTQHIYGMVDQGERNERRLTVAVAHLKAIEPDPAIKSAQDAPTKKQRGARLVPESGNYDSHRSPTLRSSLSRSLGMPKSRHRRRSESCQSQYAGGRDMNDTAREFERLLGHAALKLWPDLPRDVQELLFETAVPIDPVIRNKLAVFLHDRHPRTAHPPKPTQLA